ncbi:TPA: hypothetical protein QDB07_000853 [Burkholderia vietnamiensis]|nr:hypothetical protein [Burkholderia vietnamiensis]
MTSLNTWRVHRALTLVGTTALTLALTACGGGGGGDGGSTGGTGSTTTGTTGQSLLDAYTVPAAVAAEKTENFPTAFNASNTYLQSNCQVAGNASTTVYVGPNTLVYATTGVSDKAQALAADYSEQSIAAIKTYFGLDTSVVGFDGTKIQVCVDSSLGASAGDDSTGVSGQGAFRALDVMSVDAPSFAARYPGATSLNAPVGTSYFDLYRHEMTHVYEETTVGSVATGSIERWFNEAVAVTVSQLPMPDKATVLGYAQQDLITANSQAAVDMNVYPVYGAAIQMIMSSALGGLGNGVGSINTFLTTYRANAIAACALAIPNGVTEPAYLTDGMPAGTYNGCYVTSGASSTALQPVFDATFRQVFKDTGGGPLLLHTSDGANSLEATLASRLAAYLP